MRTTEDIKKAVYDTELIAKEIELFPHTYKTFLTEELYNNGTLHCILKRKMSTLHSCGLIAKTTIPGTRFGMAIFYSFNKNYNIVVDNDRLGISVYCFSDFVKKGRFYIEVDSYYVLKDYFWKKVDEKKTLFQGNFLKWI